MLVTSTELANIKLKSIKLIDLKELADKIRVNKTGSAADIITRLISIPQIEIDKFIKEKYKIIVKERQRLISDDDLKKELNKVQEINWGVVQGQLDQKIQTEFVRRFYRYSELISSVENKLYDDIKCYVIATWYNHWTTVLVEDHISQHPRVVPTLKNNFGVDIFFNNQPFDLKITYLPKDYKLADAEKDPKNLIIWLYENQGEQRFSAENKLFVVLAGKSKLEDSWKLKRDFDYIYNRIDTFFSSANVSLKDEILFTFRHKTYTTISKILLIVK